MGTTIKIADATFTKFFSSLTLPDRSGLTGEFLFGVDASASTRNMANPAVPATVVPSTAGSPVSPTYDAVSALVQSYEDPTLCWGFNLGYSSGNQGTVIAVSKHVTGSASMVITTEDGPAFGSIGAVGMKETLVERRMGGGAAAGSVAVVATVDLSAATDSDYLFSAGTFVKGVSTNAYGYANGALVTAENLTAAITIKTTNFVVGGLSGSNATRGGSRVAYVASFSRVLTEAEIGAAYAQVKAFMTARGVTVS